MHVSTIYLYIFENDMTIIENALYSFQVHRVKIIFFFARNIKVNVLWKCTWVVTF